ncbi:4-aminobutyrate--2-oxoglutarate transaminase [Sphingomonas jaspsi]|uniref:4-aminobutyrate--2-oxoglutarate transaminase n=1 Tax=Sphingomonas jaspsi TaxID=392409 RepID=UPI0004B40AE6|nr:4-aminobutyrate--2-oxoglutarate transaminase [Sphingomonas jaspsi]
MATNADWQARREAAVPRGVSTMHPRFIERARNAEMWDVEGKRYIDFASGIAVLNTGHNHPRVIDAVKRQMDAFSHTSFQVNPYKPYVELAERLNAISPTGQPSKTIFVTTGAEAVENAVKIARAHTKRKAIIAFKGGFHGRTMMGMALTGKVQPYKAGFGPFPGDVWHVPFPIAYHGVSEAMSLDALDSLFKADVDPADVAAIILEPVQGEGGFYQAPARFLQSLRSLCDMHGMLLIADEIQSGFARTGRMFGIEHSGVRPDLITIAKSMAGGFAIAGVTGRADIMDAANPGGLGGTYGGPPMACAAGLAVLDVIEEEGLCARADAIGTEIKERLEGLKRQNSLDCIGDVRGPGAMIALELVKGGNADAPDPDLTRQLVLDCADDGLILLSCGIRGNVIRFLCPLTIGDALLDEGLDILTRNLTRLAG